MKNGKYSTGHMKAGKKKKAPMKKKAYKKMKK